MREIQLRDAKAALSAPVEAAARGETTVITRRGKPRALIPGIGEWDRLRNIPSFGCLLPTASPEHADLPPRDTAPWTFKSLGTWVSISFGKSGNSLARWRLQHFPMTKPVAMPGAGNSGGVPFRLSSWVRRSETPGIISGTGCVRSGARIRLFPSTQRTSARFGGDR